jgi:alpha-L-fucosidase
VLSIIPTDPASFQSDPSKGRAPTPGFTNYTYVVDDYNRYFLNQLYELLTEYGPIEEVWFDGANPDPSVHETYNYAAWYDLIRRLQPNAVIMGKGPDVRWVGIDKKSLFARRPVLDAARVNEIPIGGRNHQTKSKS